MGKRYPVWSARWLFAAFVIGAVVTVVLVLLFDRHHRRLMVDLEITLSAVAVFMFIFLAIGLYSGARVRKRDAVAGELQTLGAGNPFSGSDASGCVDLGDFSGGGGCGEAIAGLVIGIVLLIVLIVGLWIFINVALIVFFLLSVALGWVFHRAIRVVFAKSKRCRGDLVSSLYYAAIYTILYTGWLLGILMAVDYLTRDKKKGGAVAAAVPPAHFESSPG